MHGCVGSSPDAVEEVNLAIARAQGGSEREPAQKLANIPAMAGGSTTARLRPWLICARNTSLILSPAPANQGRRESNTSGGTDAELSPPSIDVKLHVLLDTAGCTRRARTDR